MMTFARGRGAGPQYVLAAEALPFADRSFDVVAFITTLEFVDDATAALEEAARVSRQGLLLGVLNLASPLGLWRRLRARVRPSPYRQAHFRTPWELTHELRRVLDGRVVTIHTRTTLWPRWVPARARWLPFGAFIGVAARLDPEPPGAQS